MDGFDAVLRKYGRPGAVYRGGEAQIGPVFLQPLFEKDGQWSPTPLGRKRNDRFLLLADPELGLDGLGPDDYMELDGTAYDVETVQSVELGGKRLYWWAVVTVREDEA